MSMNLEQVRKAIDNGIPVYWHTNTAFKVFKQGDILYMANDAGEMLGVAHPHSKDFINGEPHEFYTVQPVNNEVNNDTDYLLLKIRKTKSLFIIK